MFKKMIAVCITLMLATCAIPGGAEGAKTDFAIQYVQDLMAGEKNVELYALFTDEVKAQLPETVFTTIWSQLTGQYGAFASLGDVTAQENNGVTVYFLPLHFENQGLLLQLAVDAQEKVTGLFFTNLPDEKTQVETQLPAEITEEDVTVGEGEWALPGILTLPTTGADFPAVVLVHGSGANDRDETVGSTKMFRDLAWVLAKNGIASIRYDKRTLVHASQFTAELQKSGTVREETIIDAVLAGNVLKTDSRINSTRIFVAGHSLGAMLGPRIAKESDGLFAGMVLMSGSPLKLTDIIITQNEDVLNKLTDDVRKTQQPLLDAEVAKLAALESMTEEQAMEATAFGLPGCYILDLLKYDAAATLKELKLPTFILQGGADFQISLKNGYEAWQTAAGGEAYVTLKLYPELNHLLMKYTGDPANQYSIQEYNAPASLDETVASDIVAWILDH